MNCKHLLSMTILAVLLSAAAAIRAESDDARIADAERDEHGVLTHQVRSAYQAGKTELRVLLPDGVTPRANDATDVKRYPVVYVLPVEPQGVARYGDGLDEVRKLDLHNKHQAIFVAPSFSALPWYADHPRDESLQQESFFVDVVVPFIDKSYPALPDADGRLLLGFSKSGWGAWSLLLRHGELFGRAAAWDAPMMMQEAGKFGSGPVFGSHDNFAKYRITDLVRGRAEMLRGASNSAESPPRLILTGYGNFRADHERMHDQLDSLEVPHVYRDGPHRKHDWHSGWVAETVELLLRRP